jgi:hypothetical protein
VAVFGLGLWGTGHPGGKMRSEAVVLIALIQLMILGFAWLTNPDGFMNAFPGFFG